jgi:hypothetical protein
VTVKAVKLEEKAIRLREEDSGHPSLLTSLRGGNFRKGWNPVLEPCAVANSKPLLPGGQILGHITQKRP